jgi:hypothetical protein
MKDDKINNDVFKKEGSLYCLINLITEIIIGKMDDFDDFDFAYDQNKFDDFGNVLWGKRNEFFGVNLIKTRSDNYIKK